MKDEKLPAKKPASYYFGNDNFIKMSFPFILQER